MDHKDLKNGDVIIIEWNNYNTFAIFEKFDKTVKVVWNSILSFPTEEMRDEFYNNFKDLIEQCKELL